MSKEHLQTAEHRGRDELENGKNASENVALTYCRAQMKGQVRTWKESNRKRGTYFLENTDKEVIQNTDSKLRTLTS